MNQKVTIHKSSIGYWLLTISCLFYSCKKETPADYPTVQITSPYNMEYFTVFNTFTVQAHVSDGQQLVSVSVYVANSQNIPVLSTVQIPVTSNSMNISCTYQLNDIHMNSGVYYLVVEAFNGTNVTSSFQQINVDAVPTTRTAIYAFTCSSGSVHAWKIDSAYNLSLSYSVAGNYSGSDVNSYYQQIYTSGYDSGSATAYNYSVPTSSMGWSIPAVNSSAPYFTNVYAYNDAALVSYYQGNVKYFNHEGALQLTYYTPSGYYPGKTFVWNGNFFAEEKSVSSNLAQIGTYYQPSGAIIQLAFLPGPLVAMYGYDNTHIFVFGNNGAVPYLLQYNFSGGNFYSPATLPAAQLLSVAQVNPNTYLLGFNNGTIYQYTFNPENILSFLKGSNASCIRFDSINNEVITSSANFVNIYNYTNSSLVKSIALSDSVRDVRILYNK